MTDRKNPRGWYIEDRIAEIKHALWNLEWEMHGSYFFGRRAQEMEDLSNRLLNLAKEDKGNGRGLKAREVKDAA